MTERPCDCVSCRARRLAILMLAAAVLIMVAVGVHIESGAASSRAASVGSGR